MPSSKYWRFKTIKKEERKKRLGTIFFWFAFIAAFITMIWSLFFSPFFRITEINLPKNDIISANDIYKLIKNNIPLELGNNLFILSRNQLRSELAAAFPIITKISVKKELFHALTIDFEKRVQIGIWCHPVGDQPPADQCFYFDKEGIIFKQAPQTEGTLILKIRDFRESRVSLGNKVLSDKELKFLINFNDEILKNNRFKITEFKIAFSTNSNLEAVIEGGWSIYLDQNQDPALEANNLFTLLTEVIKNNVPNLEYVDLRIPSRVFYKLK